MKPIEAVARAVSGQDDAGWSDLPENDRARLYGGGRWHDAGRTREDYRAEARAALTALAENIAPEMVDELADLVRPNVTRLLLESRLARAIAKALEDGHE